MTIQEKMVCIGLSVLKSIATYDSFQTHNKLFSPKFGIWFALTCRR